HLPQIASMADRHLVVRKRVERGRTITDVLPLEGGERVEEVARMLGGETITESARRHAREIVKQGVRTSRRYGDHAEILPANLLLPDERPRQGHGGWAAVGRLLPNSPAFRRGGLRPHY